MENKYQNLEAMKTALIGKAQRKLSLNAYDYTYDTNVLGDYFDDAISIIKDWKKNYNDSLVLTGVYDKYIVEFIIQSINYNGLEGQTSSSANGVSKTFIATPESNLKSSIPQSI